MNTIAVETANALRDRIRGGVAAQQQAASGSIFYWVFQYYTVPVTASATVPTKLLTGNAGRPLEFLRILSILDNTFPVTIGGPNVGIQTNGLDVLGPGQDLRMSTDNDNQPGIQEWIDGTQFFAICGGGIIQTLLVTAGFRDQRAAH